MAKFRCRVEPHGPHQLELKIRYPVGAEKRSRYRLDLYVFLPVQLRVNRESYAPRRFIDDVLSHIRHTSPRIALSALADPECQGSPGSPGSQGSQSSQGSPLAAVKGAIAAASASGAASAGPAAARPPTSEGAGNAPGEGLLMRDLRTLGNAFRSAVRTERSAVLRLAGQGDARELDAGVRAMLASLAAVLAEVRRLPAAALEAGAGERLQAATRWADDWISLNAEAELIRVLEALHAAGASPELLGAVRERVREESEHRRRAGYPSVARVGAPAANERAVLHESLLKKWSQGALYMSSEQLATSRGIGHIVAGIAAAAAMSFAVAATFLATHFFPANSVPWALMVVASYIFKDRIKETLRVSLSRFFPLLFFDRSGRLNDPSVRGSVGTSRETVRFCAAADCPRDVAALRNADDNPFRDVMPPESVIHYNKIVRLRSARLRTVHASLDSITEILRMKIDPWLREMDDPVSRRRVLRGDAIATVTARRVYRAHMVAALTSPGEQRTLRHYLAVLSRAGVERVDSLDAGRRLSPGGLYESAASSRE